MGDVYACRVSIRGQGSTDHHARTETAAGSFPLLRSLYAGPVVCEPRHETWFLPAADALLVRLKIARVAADPAPAAGAGLPGGWKGIVYYRLHGSPRKYWSRYDETYISTLAAALRRVPATVDAWCIFDNTASGAALENAWELLDLLSAFSALQLCPSRPGQLPSRETSRSLRSIARGQAPTEGNE
jgi:uncharacterized protein YecE (DUF72 family)